MCFWSFRTIECVALSQCMDFINKKHLLSVASCCPFSRHWLQWRRCLHRFRGRTVLTVLWMFWICHVCLCSHRSSNCSSLVKCVKWVKSTQFVGIASSPRQLPHLTSQNMEASFNFEAVPEAKHPKGNGAKDWWETRLLQIQLWMKPLSLTFGNSSKKTSYWMSPGAGFFFHDP